MALQIINIPDLPGNEAGLVVTQLVDNDDYDVIYASNESLTVQAIDTHYRFTANTNKVGLCVVEVADINGDILGTWQVYLTGTPIVHYAHDYVVIDWATIINQDAVVNLSNTTIYGVTGTGVGPYILTLTFQNSSGGAPLQGVFVVVQFNNITVASGYTDVNGVVVLNVLYAGTYKVYGYLSGFTFAGVDLVVDGNETPAAYQMVAMLPPAPVTLPAFNLTRRVVNNIGSPVVGAKVSYQMLRPPSGVLIYDDTKKELTSNALGDITFVLFQGAEYNFWRGESSPIRIAVPSDADSNWIMPPILGNDIIDPCKTV